MKIRESTFSERVFLGAISILRRFSIRSYFANQQPIKRAMLNDIYHLFLWVLLFFVTFFIRIIPFPVIVLLLVYVINEISVTTMFDVLIESFNKQLQGRRSLIRSVLWSVYSYFTTIWIFAIYYFKSGETGSYVEKMFVPISSIFDGFYFSMLTMMTISYGNIVPKTDSIWTRIFILIEPLIGIGILVVYVAITFAENSQRLPNHARKR